MINATTTTILKNSQAYAIGLQFAIDRLGSSLVANRSDERWFFGLISSLGHNLHAGDSRMVNHGILVLENGTFMFSEHPKA
jgi:hypothetical protein